MLNLRIGIAILTGIFFFTLAMISLDATPLILAVAVSPPNFVLIVGVVLSWIVIIPKNATKTLSDRIVEAFIHCSPWLFILGSTLTYISLFSSLDKPEMIGPPVMVQFVLIFTLTFLLSIVALPLKFRIEMRNPQDAIEVTAIADTITFRFAGKYLFGSLIFLSSLILMMFLKHAGDLILMLAVSPPTMVLFLGCGIGIPLIALKKGSFRIALRSIFTRSLMTKAEAIAVWNLARTLRHSFLLAGILGMVAGTSKVLQRLDQPELLGPGLMVALVAPTYTAILYILIVLPLEYRVSIATQE